jgi:integrase
MPRSIGIKLYKRDDSEIWQYYLRYKGKTYRGSTGKEDQGEAEDEAYSIQFKITKGADIVGERNVRIDEFMKIYLEWVKQEHRKQTFKSYTTVSIGFCKFLKTRYPKVILLKEVTPEIIEAYKSERMTKVSLTTTHNFIKVVKTMFNWAVKHNPLFIKDDPTKLVANLSKKKIREDQKPVVILTLEELEKFVEYTKKHYPELYPIYMVFMYTGARKTELFTLEWDDIDWERRVIKIRYKKGFIPKTDERSLPLHNKLAEILKSIPRKSKYIFLDGKKPYLYPDEKKKRGYYESHKPSRCLAEIMKAIGKPEFTRIHWLRHSFATIVAKKHGIEFARVVLGHTDIRTTQRYLHFDRDYIQENLNKIEALDKIFK